MPFTNVVDFKQAWDKHSYNGTNEFWGFIDAVIKDRIITHLFSVLESDTKFDAESRLKASVFLTQVAQGVVAAKFDKNTICSQVKYFTPFYGDKTINELVEILNLWQFLD